MIRASRGGIGGAKPEGPSHPQDEFGDFTWNELTQDLMCLNIPKDLVHYLGNRILGKDFVHQPFNVFGLCEIVNSLVLIVNNVNTNYWHIVFIMVIQCDSCKDLSILAVWHKTRDMQI